MLRRVGMLGKRYVCGKNMVYERKREIKIDSGCVEVEHCTEEVLCCKHSAEVILIRLFVLVEITEELEQLHFIGLFWTSRYGVEL